MTPFTLDMILIFSSKYDKSTLDVVAWLKFFKKKYYVCNDLIHITVNNLTIAENLIDFEFTYNKKLFKYSDIKSIWYRRGQLTIKHHLKLNKKFKVIYNSIFDHIKHEENVILEFIESLIIQKKHINSPLKHAVNKLITLNLAKKIGFNIPQTFITSSRKILEEVSDDKNLITKSISNNPNLDSGIITYWALTQEFIKKRDLNLINEYFSPSLFQKKIDKKFEIRTFFIQNKIYSMAILSQSNRKTSIDYRNYDEKYPNRNVPFRLPKNIENKIIRLSKLLKINSGSIDIIYGIDCNYYFLEINPIGQFAPLSNFCNYEIEKTIANYLSE